MMGRSASLTSPTLLNQSHYLTEGSSFNCSISEDS